MRRDGLLRAGTNLEVPRRHRRPGAADQSPKPEEFDEARFKFDRPLPGTPPPEKVPIPDRPYVFAANLLIGDLPWWVDERSDHGPEEVIE